MKYYRFNHNNNNNNNNNKIKKTAKSSQQYQLFSHIELVITEYLLNHELSTNINMILKHQHVINMIKKLDYSITKIQKKR